MYADRAFGQLAILMSTILIGLSSQGCQGEVGAAEASDQYYQFSVNEDSLQGLPDFSDLNSTLKPSDKIFACGAHFCKVGKDLTPNTNDDERILFFGVNFSNQANFPDADDAARIARRLRRLGANIVRIHYVDHFLSKGEQTPIGVLSDGAFPSFSKSGVQRLKVFIQALADEGIYVNLNINVAYRFRPDEDNVPHGIIPLDSKPLYHFSSEMVNRTSVYAKQLISLLGLKNSPSLAMVEISNENSLVYSYQLASLNRGEWQLNKVIQGPYRDELSREWKRFSGEDYFPDSADNSERSRKFLSFLMELDRQYFEKIKSVISLAAGDSVPVTGTQLSWGGLPELNSQASLTYFDNHFYHDHYAHSPGKTLGDEWWIRDVSLLEPKYFSYLLGLAYLRSLNKPFTVSEFNQPWPNSHGGEIIPVMSALGAIQDWDGLIFFQYRDDRRWDENHPRWFNLSGDPTKLIQFGQLAYVFRGRLIAPSASTAVFNVSSASLVEPLHQGIAGWDVQRFYRRSLDFDDFLPVKSKVATSVSNGSALSLSTSGPGKAHPFEVQYQPKMRRLEIVAPRVVGAFGYLGPTESVELGSVVIRNRQTVIQPISITITCHDGRAVDGCRKLLLTNATASLGSGSNKGIKKLEMLAPNLGEPRWSFSPIEGKAGGADRIAANSPVFMRKSFIDVVLPLSSNNVSAHFLDAAGKKTSAQPPLESLSGGQAVLLHLGSEVTSPWLQLDVN